MIGWAADTAIDVSLLILAVLLVRVPFAATFGARAAYALWLAPAARAITPPLTIPTMPIGAPSLGGTADYFFVTTPMQSAPSTTIGAFVLAAWLGGATLFLALHIWRHHRFLNSVLESGRPLLIAGVPYDIIASNRIDGPMATGLIHPLILVPADFQDHLSADEQRFALWHEQLHHRRGDIWASAGALVLFSLLWFNPFAHFALGAFRRDMEAACDARLLSEAGQAAAPAYAATILRCAAKPVPRSLCALTAIDELKGRLMMLTLNHGRTRRLAGLVLASAIAVGGLATASAAQEKSESTTTEVKKVEKKIVIRHVDGKEVGKIGEIPEPGQMAANCPGEKFEVESAGGTEGRRENVKFILCAKAGERMLTALERAEADIRKQDDMSAERKADILAKIHAKIAELRAKG
jgi:beta-lactamase regulating signal transducer with metallopeptidase domain